MHSGCDLLHGYKYVAPYYCNRNHQVSKDFESLLGQEVLVAVSISVTELSEMDGVGQQLDCLKREKYYSYPLFLRGFTHPNYPEVYLKLQYQSLA